MLSPVQCSIMSSAASYESTWIHLGSLPADRKFFQSDVSLNMSKHQTVARRHVIHLGIGWYFVLCTVMCVLSLTIKRTKYITRFLPRSTKGVVSFNLFVYYSFSRYLNISLKMPIFYIFETKKYR
jgi:hypothetical protein